LPLPQPEGHLVPLPALPRRARFGAEGIGQPLRLTADNPRYRHPGLDRGRTTGMIVIGMAEQQQIETSHVQRAQRRQDDTLTGIEIAETRPGIVKQCVLPGTHQHGQPLPDIQHPDVGTPVVQLRRRQKQCRQ